ncbi:hypothetical protein BJX70DRAFT_408869 [Aspergillus crustosus]
MSIPKGVQEPQQWLPLLINKFEAPNARQFKIFFRCWVAAWVACILMFIQPVLSSFGADIFVACGVIFIVPPSGVLFEYLLGVVTIFVGICLAWAWGVITMKAALASRPAAETLSRLSSLEEAVRVEAQMTGEPGGGISQRLVFDGWMLDTRVTVVVYCMLCVFVYLMARLRAANQKTTPAFIFSMLITGSFLCFGPLLPSFDGLLPLPLVKPAAVGVGIGVACTVLLFPQSTVDVIVEGIDEVVEALKAPLQFSLMASGIVDATAPLGPDQGLGSAAADADPDAEYIGKCQAKVIGAYQKLDPSFAFLPLEFSVGCWGADVVEGFQDPLRHLVVAVLALADFHKSGTQGDLGIGQIRGALGGSGSGSSSDAELNGNGNGKGSLHVKWKKRKPDEKRPKEIGAHQRAQLAGLVRALYEEDHALVEELAIKLRETGLAAIESCLEGLTAIKESLQFISRQHWYRKASAAEHEQVHRHIRTVLGRLHESRMVFVREMTDGLVEAYDPILEKDHGAQKDQGSGPGNLSGVIVCMNFQEHMVDALTRTEVLLEHISHHFPAALRTRLWWPTRLSYAVRWALKRQTKTPTMASGVTDNPDMKKGSEAAKAAPGRTTPLLATHRGYRPRSRHPIGKAVLGVYRWLTCDEGLYALRVVIATIAVSIPAVIPRTAGFFYREKGLWALVTAQLGLSVYMADFTFSNISPAAGTIAGGLLGLLGWYMGSGNGPGNPYGLSAVCAVFLVLMLRVRLRVPPDHIPGATLVGVTFLLVIVYSYVDTHNPTYGDPGAGYHVFWRRVLLILIGSAAAMIIQIFPRPPSAARHVCRSLSLSVRTLSDHYALLLSSWTHRNCHPQAQAQAQADTNRNADPDTDRSALAATEPLWLSLTQTLHDLATPIQNLRFEFSSSRFDSTCLEQIRQICHTLNNTLARLLVAAATLPPEHRGQLALMTGMLDHRCIGEVMAVLSICEQTLRTGDALPEIMPVPLVRRALEYGRSHSHSHSQHHHTENGMGKDDVLPSAEMIRDEGYRRYCVALAAYIRFLGRVDDLVLVIKGVLGEAHLVAEDLMEMEMDLV